MKFLKVCASTGLLTRDSRTLNVFVMRCLLSGGLRRSSGRGRGRGSGPLQGLLGLTGARQNLTCGHDPGPHNNQERYQHRQALAVSPAIEGAEHAQHYGKHGGAEKEDESNPTTLVVRP